MYNFGGVMYRNESWDILVGDYLSGNIEELELLKCLLSERKYSAKQTNITYRVINHWAEQGLISSYRNSDSAAGWRKLCLFDLIWINVLVELRKYGMSISMLRNTFESVFNHQSISSLHIPVFEIGVCLCIQKTPVSLIVFSDGAAEVIRDSDLDLTLSMGLISPKSYVLINLNECCQQILSGAGKATRLPKFQLSNTEIDVLSALQTKELASLEILFKDGRPHSFNQKILNRDSKVTSIEDLLRAIEFGEVRVKKENGKIVFFESNQKQKF